MASAAVTNFTKFDANLVNQNISEKNKSEKKSSESSVFLVCAKVIKMNAKNVLRTIRQAFTWLTIFFENCKNNASIPNLIKFTKIGEDSFVFGSFGESILKITHGIKNCFEEGIQKSISYIRETALDLVWNFFKICKAVSRYKIIFLCSKYITCLSGIGGMAFAINSGFRFNQERQKKNVLINEPKKADDLKNKKLEIDCRLIRMVKNICTLIFGTIVSMSAIFGPITPEIFTLVLGTVILIADIGASAIEVSNGLKLQ